MAMLQGNQGQTGKQLGQNLTVGFGETSDMMVTELQPKYYENTYRGLVFSASTAGGGVTLAATHLFSTAIGTFTPILAIYNPLTSTKNLVIMSSHCSVTNETLAAPTATGGFWWVVQSGQLITNAQTATPVNNLTFKSSGSGSVAVGITNVALAGAVGNPIVLRGTTSLIMVVTASANTQGLAGITPVDFVDGAIIVPPGGYAGFANGVSAVAGSVSASITWAEIPI